MMSCEMITAGRFAFDAFEPIRGVNRGGSDEGWALDSGHPFTTGVRFVVHLSGPCTALGTVLPESGPLCVQYKAKSPSDGKRRQIERVTHTSTK